MYHEDIQLLSQKVIVARSFGQRMHLARAQTGNFTFKHYGITNKNIKFKGSESAGELKSYGRLSCSRAV